jgi:hypothetical protein
MLRRVGIREALTQADRIRQIAASNPMDRVATLRFLLALLYWCKGNPPTSMEVTTSDSFPADWFTRLDQNRDCFNLLGDGKRFYQYWKDGDKSLTANYLIHEIPTGTNLWHFRHVSDEVDGLCPTCCAMGLLRLPLFSTSGGRGKPPGINAKPPLYVMPVGASLAETLRLSWRKVTNLGTPAWEKPDLQLPKTGEVPLLTGLTWLPRRVWLGNPEKLANCISCGRTERLILSSVFAPIGGGSRPDWWDPHVIYEHSGTPDATALHARDALSSPDRAAGQWAEIMARMLNAPPLSVPKAVAGDETISYWGVGFSTVQNDKYLEAVEHMLPFACSPDDSEAFIKAAEQWQKEGTGIVRKMRPPNEKGSSRKRQHVEIPPMFAAIRPHVEGKVSAQGGALLAGEEAAWDKAARAYLPMMEMVATSLSPGFTTAAVQRRRQIANALPHMTPTRGPAKKARRKEGGAT